MGFFRKESPKDASKAPSTGDLENYKPPKDGDLATCYAEFFRVVERIPFIKAEEKKVQNGRGNLHILLLTQKDGSRSIPCLWTSAWTDEAIQRNIKWASIIRGSTDLEVAKILLCTAYDAPEEVIYYTRPDPSVLFQFDCVYGCSDDSTKNAEVCVELFKRRFDRSLDFTPKSLEGVEALLEEKFRSGKAAHVLLTTTNVVGGYVGEVFRKTLGGKWADPPQGWSFKVLNFENFPKEGESMTLNPIGKVSKFFDNGPSDSFYALWKHAHKEVKGI